MGHTKVGSQRIISLINNHHRIMTRSPVHITRENTSDFFRRLQIDPPWIMLHKQFERLKEHLSQRRVTLSDPAMSHAADDVTVLTPDYPPCHIIIRGATADPCAQVDDLKCPECHRSFAQAGPLKRRMREYHSIPCHIEDVFVALRDTTNGYPTCSHCARSFTDMYRLRDHINRRACMQFNSAKDRNAPICDRPDLRTHLRYKSIPGLLLNQSLMAELASHCAYIAAVPFRHELFESTTQMHIHTWLALLSMHVTRSMDWPILEVVKAFVSSVSNHVVMSAIMHVVFCTS